MNRAGIHTKAVLGKKKKTTTLFHRPHTDFYVQFGAGKTLIIWNKFSRGPQALKLARGCSPCPVRRGWGNATCSAWRRGSFGVTSQQAPSTRGEVSKKVEPGIVGQRT